MALKKSQLYSSLWASCDELRGGMDASEYKNYVLALLLIKYISDKYAGRPYAPIIVPDGASFCDMVEMKGKKDIGEQINTKIIAKLVENNPQFSLSEFADFDDATRLGNPDEKVDRLSRLIAIFQDPALDFSRNRAGDDDILGDAYEYLMRHFATESGKSKGQFYTPAEVSRLIAQLLGIRAAPTSPATTIYDPTCGSGSLLLKVADEAGTKVSLYGQEKDHQTSGLARMNLILHDNPTNEIRQGNTLAAPWWKDGDGLKRFDYVVANPPFSDKAWSTGLSLDKGPDRYGRFDGFGVPPPRQGDYAYLLHIIRSLKATGKGACILPHGVLFRGNAEAAIRENLVKKGYIKAIIGLPPNLFYGTGIPACVVLLDKESAETREGIFLIDASAGCEKDGPKNRLRERDIHKIVDAYSRQAELPRFSRFVTRKEIDDNGYNLNLPRYINTQTPEDIQDIDGHLRGGIPSRDIEALADYWAVCPGLRACLFRETRPDYHALAIEKPAIKTAILGHPEFQAVTASMTAHFEAWKQAAAKTLKALVLGCQPKHVIAELSEGLLRHHEGRPLIDPYAVYEHLMKYWSETMQDDCYLIAADGWKAEVREIAQVKKKDGKMAWPEEHDYAAGKRRFKCDLAPREVVVERYFKDRLTALQKIEEECAAAEAALQERMDEEGGEGGLLEEVIEGVGDKRKITAKAVKARLKDIGTRAEDADERAALRQYEALLAEQSKAESRRKAAEKDLEQAIAEQYKGLPEDEVRTLVVDGKWLATLDALVRNEINGISQKLTKRVKELAERYETSLPALTARVAELDAKVSGHLGRMGFVWT